MEWLNNLGNAIKYIEDHLDDEISYDEVARIACCSTFYFQRVFSYVAGISLAEYIRRRRMSQAAFELQRTDQKVLDIALKYGYSSPTSFNRAFQNIHGVTPVIAKNMGTKLNLYPPIHFSVQITGESAMSYHIMEKEAIRIIGIRTPLVEDPEENMKNVPAFWNSALQSDDFAKICKLSNSEPKGILGVSVYNNPNDIFYYIAVASKSPAPKGMFECIIPATTWVVFENDGFFKEDVQNVYRRFLTEWLPFSGYEYAELPDIEVYPIIDGKPAKGHSEVWIAIKRRK